MVKFLSEFQNHGCKIVFYFALLGEVSQTFDDGLLNLRHRVFHLVGH